MFNMQLLNELQETSGFIKIGHTVVGKVDRLG